MQYVQSFISLEMKTGNMIILDLSNIWFHFIGNQLLDTQRILELEGPGAGQWQVIIKLPQSNVFFSISFYGLSSEEPQEMLHLCGSENYE